MAGKPKPVPAGISLAPPFARPVEDPNIDFFEKLEYDDRYANSEVRCFEPIGPIEKAASYEVKIPKLNEAFGYVADTFYFEITVSMCSSDGGNLNNKVNNTPVVTAPANNVLHTCFKTINWQVGTEYLGQASDNYALKAFIHTKYNYNSGAQKHNFSAQGYYHEDFSKLDNPFDTEKNTGLLELREKFVTDGLYDSNKTAKFSGPLFTPFATGKPFIACNTVLTINFEESSDLFRTVCSDPDEHKKVKLVVHSVKVYVTVVTHKDNVLRELRVKWKRIAIDYLISKVTVTTEIIDMRRMDWKSGILFSEVRVPTQIFVIIMESAVLAGDSKNHELLVPGHPKSLRRVPRLPALKEGKL